MILRKEPVQKIRERAKKSGMRTLREVGWDKVKAGITTPEEVLRVTEMEEN